MATFISTLAIFSLLLSVSQSQDQPPPPSNQTCNAIFISYVYNSGDPLPPNLLPSDPTRQPYRFNSTLTVLNNGLEELKSWRVFVGFRHQELLVSAPNAVLADGTSLPANVSDGAVFAGSSMPDLKSAAQTAGDENQMKARIELVGTQFGIGDPDVPLPSTLSLSNPAPAKLGNNELRLCCTKDSSVGSKAPPNTNFQPIQDGDLTILYDVIKSYDTNYWAQVTISNHNPIGRLDNWRLSWDWTRDEFIYSMKGPYPDVVDTTDCFFGRQGDYYRDMDLSAALNCKRRPTIVDLPVDKTNDTNLGLIPFCCRSGKILPASMDASKSKSVFLMQVYKMPPDLERRELSPPQNWNITGALNPGYRCGPPARVSPTLLPAAGGLPSESAAVASWQVVCNIASTKLEKPKCCVSFSAFFNDSVIPCTTCACGCNNQHSNACSATAPALLLPSDALLKPFENRTRDALDWAELKNLDLPNPLPCGDNCGISINWHLLTDFRGGWTARMTLFNWDEASVADWFAAVELDKAVAGFEAVYSFNGSVSPDAKNIIFLQGFPGLNYLAGEKDGADPKKDPRVPGTKQSVISFTKKKTPGIDVARGDGFPIKVYFNGEECSLPSVLPATSNGHPTAKTAAFCSIVLGLLVLAFLLRPNL